MKHAISLSIFVVLAFIVWLSITTGYNDNNQFKQAKNKLYTEIFMNEFEIISMNENGTPNYILKGSHLQRTKGSDNTEIQQPEFQLLQEDKHWTVVADHAIVNDKHETIQLKNNVIMQQKNTVPAVTIRTQYLFINTRTQIAQTKALVDLTQGNSRLTSNGMIFNNNTSELELSSNVNGYFSPHD